MNVNQLIDAICSHAPAYWQRDTDGILNRSLLETFIQGALGIEASQTDTTQLYDISEVHPLRISAQARDRAVTGVARAHFTCAKNQLKQHQQSRLETLCKKATASDLVKIPVRHARYKTVRTNHLPNSANIAREEAIASDWLERVRTTAPPQDVVICALYALYELINLGYGLQPAASIILHLRRGELRLPTLCSPVHPDEPGPYIHHRIIPCKLSSALQHWAVRLDKDPNTRARGAKLTQRQARSPAFALPLQPEKHHTSAGLERLIKRLQKAHIQQFTAFQAEETLQELSLPVSLKQLSIFAARLRKRGLTHSGLQHALYTQLESLPLPTDTPNGLGDFLVDTHYHLTSLQRLPYHAPQVGAVNDVPALRISNPPSTSDTQSNVESDMASMGTVNVAQLHDTYSLDELYHAQADRYLRQCLREWEICFGKDYLQTRDRQSFIDQLQQQMLRVQQRFGDDAGLAVALFWLGTRVIGVGQKRVKFATALDFGRRVAGKTTLLNRNIPVRLSEWEPHHPGCLFKALDTEARGTRTRQQLCHQTRMFLQFAREIGRLPPEIEIPTLNRGYIPFKRRNEFLTEGELIEFCERLQIKHSTDGGLLALLHAIWFYTGVRPNELLSRTFRDIHLGNGEGYLIIQYGKSDQARRKIELEEDLPLWVQTLVRSYLEARLASFPTQRRHFNNVALFGPDNDENAYDAQQMTRYLIELVKVYTGKNIDLHTHRHRFITVQMVNASLPADFDRSHLKPGLIPEPNPQRHGDISESYEYHKKQVGHLYASTAFESYCHAFGLMLSAHELCRTLLQRIHI